eukprot:1414618-Rhodomonas_salina.1
MAPGANLQFRTGILEMQQVLVKVDGTQLKEGKYAVIHHLLHMFLMTGHGWEMGIEALDCSEEMVPVTAVIRRDRELWIRVAKNDQTALYFELCRIICIQFREAAFEEANGQPLLLAPQARCCEAFHQTLARGFQDWWQWAWNWQSCPQAQSYFKLRVAFVLMTFEYSACTITSYFSAIRHAHTALGLLPPLTEDQTSSTGKTPPAQLQCASSNQRLISVNTATLLDLDVLSILASTSSLGCSFTWMQQASLSGIDALNRSDPQWNARRVGQCFGELMRMAIMFFLVTKISSWTHMISQRQYEG